MCPCARVFFSLSDSVFIVAEGELLLQSFYTLTQLYLGYLVV